MFGISWPDVKHIKPEEGCLDPSFFWKEYAEMRNSYDTLCSRLNVSGRNESGVILDCTALTFCKNGIKLLSNFLQFYIYLLWKDCNVSFVTNRLPENCNQSCGLSTPPTYSRSKGGSSSEESSSKSVSTSKKLSAVVQKRNIQEIYNSLSTPMDDRLKKSKMLHQQISGASKVIKLGADFTGIETYNKMKENILKWSEELTKLEL